jgi:DNA polymerase-1
MAGWNIDVPTTRYYGIDPRTGRDVHTSDQMQQLINALSDNYHHREIAVDTETTGLDTTPVWRPDLNTYQASMPLYFSLAWGNERATLHASLLPYFQNLFKDPYKLWIMANAKYDAHILANVGCVIGGSMVDTCVMHALLYEDKPHGLKFMCKHLAGWSWGDFQEQFGKIGKNQSAEELIRRAEREDFNRLVEYASNDALGTKMVFDLLKAELQRAGTHSLFRDGPFGIETLWDLFHKVEIPYTKTLWRMERHGIKVNKQRLEAARPQAVEHIQRIESRLVQLRGKRININSPMQLREWFDQQGLKALKYTKGGKGGNRTPSTDAAFLKHYADMGNESCSLILEHRSYSKLLGTYIDGLHQLLDQDDRIHTRFNQDVARTGRLSSSDPNLQNIPRPENDHWDLRGSFIPREGYTMLCFDYSQLEMRLLAAASLEQSMIDMIHSGRDIHMGNAELVFGLDYADILEAKRKKEAGEPMTSHDKECMAARAAVKAIGFGILYGMGPEKLAASLGLTRSEAEAKIQQFLNAYPAVKAFTDEAIAETLQSGYAFTVLGRRRNIPEIGSRNRTDRSRGERLAVNTQIQGSAADVVKMAQILYDKLNFENMYGCRMILQVHDELVFECPNENVDFMCREIKDVMHFPFPEPLKVFLDVDGGPGQSWGEAK